MMVWIEEKMFMNRMELLIRPRVMLLREDQVYVKIGEILKKRTLKKNP